MKVAVFQFSGSSDINENYKYIAKAILEAAKS